MKNDLKVMLIFFLVLAFLFHLASRKRAHDSDSTKELAQHFSGLRNPPGFNYCSFNSLLQMMKAIKLEEKLGGSSLRFVKLLREVKH